MSTKPYLTLEKAQDTERLLKQADRLAEDIKDRALERGARNFMEGVMWGILGSSIAWLILVVALWGVIL